MNVSSFISIVRQCLHEETSLTDFTCQIDHKKNKTAAIFVYRIKAVYVCKAPWWPVNPKTCITVCHFGASSFTRKQNTRTHHQRTNSTYAFRQYVVVESKGGTLPVVELGVMAGFIPGLLKLEVTSKAFYLFSHLYQNELD